MLKISFAIAVVLASITAIPCMADQAIPATGVQPAPPTSAQCSTTPIKQVKIQCVIENVMPSEAASLESAYNRAARDKGASTNGGALIFMRGAVIAQALSDATRDNKLSDSYTITTTDKAQAELAFPGVAHFPTASANGSTASGSIDVTYGSSLKVTPLIKGDDAIGLDISYSSTVLNPLMHNQVVPSTTTTAFSVFGTLHPVETGAWILKSRDRSGKGNLILFATPTIAS